MANISKLNVQGAAYNLRDADSLHYIGKINELPSTSTASITTDIVTGHTIAKYDYIVVGTDRLSYVCTAVTTSGEPATTTVTWTLISEAAAEISVQDVKVNDTSIVTNHTANIPIATNAAVGLVQAGTNLDIDSGVISVATATSAVKGVVQIGSNIDVNAGTISVPTADATSTQDAKFGVVKTGDNITNTSGVISVPVATASGAASEAFGVVKTGTNITNTSGVIDVEDAAVGTKGVVALVGSIGNSSTAATDKAPTEKAVADALAAMPEPMVFRGTLGSQESGATITALPVDGSAKKGDTYKVITAGTYDSQVAKIGDTFICNEKTGTAPSGTNTWVLIPSGDEPNGTVTSVAVSSTGTGLTIVTSEGAGNPITTSGTITVGIAEHYQLMTDDQAAQVATIGNSKAVYNSVTASATAAEQNSVAPARVGTGDNAETLYIDFLNFGTDAVVGEATS